MSQENVKVVQSMYEAFARGDIPTVIGALDPQVEWWEAESFIYADGNPYVGPDAVLQGVFQRIGEEWDGFAVAPEEVLDAGDKVITWLLQRDLQKKPPAFARAVRALLYFPRREGREVPAIH
jgi:ketosteroid isomerase-like protein